MFAADTHTHAHTHTHTHTHIHTHTHKPSSYQGGRGHWAIDYARPQSLIMTIFVRCLK